MVQSMPTQQQRTRMWHSTHGAQMNPCVCTLSALSRSHEELRLRRWASRGCDNSGPKLSAHCTATVTAAANCAIPSLVGRRMGPSRQVQTVYCWFALVGTCWRSSGNALGHALDRRLCIAESGRKGWLAGRQVAGALPSPIHCPTIALSVLPTCVRRRRL